MTKERFMELANEAIKKFNEKYVETIVIAGPEENQNGEPHIDEDGEWELIVCYEDEPDWIMWITSVSKKDKVIMIDTDLD